MTLACKDGSRTWPHKTVLSRGSTFIDFEPDYIMLQYYLLLLWCLIYSNSAAGKVAAFAWRIIRGARMRTLQKAAQWRNPG